MVMWPSGNVNNHPPVITIFVAGIQTIPNAQMGGLVSFYPHGSQSKCSCPWSRLKALSHQVSPQKARVAMAKNHMLTKKHDA